MHLPIQRQLPAQRCRMTSRWMPLWQHRLDSRHTRQMQACHIVDDAALHIDVAISVWCGQSIEQLPCQLFTRRAGLPHAQDSYGQPARCTLPLLPRPATKRKPPLCEQQKAPRSCMHRRQSIALHAIRYAAHFRCIGVERSFSGGCLHHALGFTASKQSRPAV